MYSIIFDAQSMHESFQKLEFKINYKSYHFLQFMRSKHRYEHKDKFQNVDANWIRYI